MDWFTLGLHHVKQERLIGLLVHKWGASMRHIVIGLLLFQTHQKMKSPVIQNSAPLAWALVAGSGRKLFPGLTQFSIRYLPSRIGTILRMTKAFPGKQLAQTKTELSGKMVIAAANK
jgi:hypothetical protein